jgi:hypothetical protein
MSVIACEREGQFSKRPYGVTNGCIRSKIKINGRNLKNNRKPNE